MSFHKLPQTVIILCARTPCSWSVSTKVDMNEARVCTSEYKNTITELYAAILNIWFLDSSAFTPT